MRGGTSMHELLRQLIPKGKENAVNNAYLQEVLHTSRREVSAAIHELRAEGHLICADNHGYYTADTDEELVTGYDTLWKKATSNLATLKSMRREIQRRNLLQLTAEAKAREKRRNEQKTKAERLANRENQEEGNREG